MTLNPGKMVFLSVVGHKQFLYPGKKRARIKKKTEACRLPWVKVGGLTPMLVESRALGILDSASRIPIWVEA